MADAGTSTGTSAGSGAAAAGGSSLGPALFIGLSLFVAVSQGEPEIVFVNPSEAWPFDELSKAPQSDQNTVPAPLIRPFEVRVQTPRAVLNHPVVASFEPSPAAVTTPASRPPLPAPALLLAARGATGPDAPQMQGAASRTARPPDLNIASGDAVPAREPLPAAPRVVALLALPFAVAPPADEPSRTRASLRPSLPGSPVAALNGLDAETPPTAGSSVPRPEAVDVSRVPATPAGAGTVLLALASEGPAPAPQTPPTGASEVPAERLPATHSAPSRPLTGRETDVPVAPTSGSAQRPALDTAIPELTTPRSPQLALQTEPALPRIGDPARINAERVYLRIAPDINGETLGLFDTGTRATVFGQSGNWLRVRLATQDGPQDGWVWARYVTLDDPG